jgi:hypothetical protein
VYCSNLANLTRVSQPSNSTAGRGSISPTCS